MNPTEHVLILGPCSDRLALLAERMRTLGHETFHADTLDDAVTRLERDGVQLKMAVVDSGLTDEGRIDLAALRRHTRRERLVYVGVGKPPEARSRQRLRAAGVELALWDPSGDHALRFQTNRALAGSSLAGLSKMRSETRVPTDWHARALVGGREKTVSVYSISSGGAFLATDRPSLQGASVEIELPLAPGPTHLRGQVLYTNVPGNLREQALPDGMAVRFSGNDPTTRRNIRYSIAASASSLVV